jgi:hypothetical protein
MTAEPVLTFTRPDGIKVHIVRSMMVSWSPDTDQRGTKINLSTGFQTVRETPEQITAAYNV